MTIRMTAVRSAPITLVAVVSRHSGPDDRALTA